MRSGGSLAAWKSSSLFLFISRLFGFRNIAFLATLFTSVSVDYGVG